MKFRIILALYLLLFVSTSSTLAQEAVEGVPVDLMTVDLWPDYDRAAMLVLLTGVLPPDTAFPATVTIPLPEEATLNAVARITADNQMIDDLEVTEAADAVTFTTSDLRFRVEYYTPYEADGLDRSYTFRWTADFPVAQMEVSVQEPAAASSLTVEPAAASVTTGQNDGLTYHVLPLVNVAAGETYAASVSYTMTSPQLTVNAPQQRRPDPVGEAPAPTPTTGGFSFDWPLLLVILGAAIIVAVIVWQLVLSSRLGSRKPRKPAVRCASKRGAGAATAKQTRTAKFCHECGTALTTGDKFCRNCGTAVKQ